MPEPGAAHPAARAGRGAAPDIWIPAFAGMTYPGRGKGAGDGPTSTLLRAQCLAFGKPAPGRARVLRDVAHLPIRHVP